MPNNLKSTIAKGWTRVRRTANSAKPPAAINLITSLLKKQTPRAVQISDQPYPSESAPRSTVEVTESKSPPVILSTETKFPSNDDSLHQNQAENALSLDLPVEARLDPYRSASDNSRPDIVTNPLEPSTLKVVGPGLDGISRQQKLRLKQ